MAETNLVTFSYKEVVEALIKKQDLHDGIWALYIEFGIGAANACRRGGRAEADLCQPRISHPAVRATLRISPSGNEPLPARSV